MMLDIDFSDPQGNKYFQDFNTVVNMCFFKDATTAVDITITVLDDSDRKIPIPLELRRVNHLIATFKAFITALPAGWKLHSITIEDDVFDADFIGDVMDLSEWSQQQKRSAISMFMIATKAHSYGANGSIAKIIRCTDGEVVYKSCIFYTSHLQKVLNKYLTLLDQQDYTLSFSGVRYYTPDDRTEIWEMFSTMLPIYQGLYDFRKNNPIQKV